MTQWHPVFAQLLRPAVERYYEVQTTIPVGDAPREADFVLLRRTGQGTPTFRGIWRHLTPWNVLEFKGPTVSPRHGDIALLIELGLGIDRRLRAEQPRGQRRMAPEEVSFWYLANRLGRRFLRQAEQLLGPLEQLDPGLWRCRVLGRMVLLVSSIDLPVDEDSLPLHIVGREPAATERQVAELVLEQPNLQQFYSSWVATLHPEAWKEIEDMARTRGKGLNIDWEAVIDALGAERLNQLLSNERVIELMGKKKIINRISVDDMIANLSEAKRRELKQRLR